MSSTPTETENCRIKQELDQDDSSPSLDCGRIKSEATCFVREDEPSASTYRIPPDFAACIPHDSGELEKSDTSANDGMFPLKVEQADENDQPSYGVMHGDDQSSTQSSDTDIYDANIGDQESSGTEIYASSEDEAGSPPKVLPKSQELATKKTEAAGKMLECQVCSKSFYDFRKFKRHQLSHSGERPFQCAQCEKTFSHKGGLTQHVRWCHPGIRNIKSNDAKTREQNLPRKSKKQIIGGETHDDDDSDATWAETKSRRKTKQSRPKSPPQHHCSQCDESFKLNRDLLNHLVTHGEKPFVCDEQGCKKVFGRKSLLTAHRHTHAKVKPHMCEVCGKTFAHRTPLLIHQRLHSGERPFACEICGKTFAWTASLAQHKLIHAGERKYSCKKCNKTFMNSSALYQHDRTHTGERPFKCDVCGKSFAQSSAMNAHERVHTGERPYVCEECGQAFKESSKLTHHRRIKHQGERPYQCDECGKKFTRRSGLNRHKLSVHSVDKQFQCPICGRSFSDEVKFTSHKVMHDMPGQFRCDLCQRNFSRKSGLRRHDARFHRSLGPVPECRYQDAESSDSGQSDAAEERSRQPSSAWGSGYAALNLQCPGHGINLMPFRPLTQ